MVGGQQEAPAALSPRKTGNPLYRKLGILPRQRGLHGKPRHTVIGSLGSPACRESLHRLRYPGRRIYMYTRVNKNPSALNFLSPKPEVTCGTVAFIIRVVSFPHICAFVPFLCPPFITINHTAYILTEDDNTFA